MQRYILLCLIVILSGCADIDKALYTASDYVSSVDRVTGERSLNLTDRNAQILKSNAEIEKLIARAEEKNIPLNETVDKEAYQRLERVFSRVHQVSHLRNEKWDVILLPDETFNAFVNGGTYVMVHSGLIKQIKNDDELAAVLGHELAHVAANHRYEGSTLETFSTLTGSKSISRNTFQSAATHEDEEEADEIGILYAALAGYDPYAAANLWKRMLDNRGDYSRVVVNHPIYSERHRKSKKLADIYNSYYISGRINTDYEEILETNSVFGSARRSNSLASGEGGGLLSLLDVAMNGINKHYEAKAEESRQLLRTQRIALTEKLLKILSIRKINDTTVRISFIYKGIRPLQNLTFLAAIRTQEISKRLENTILPNRTFEFELDFGTPLLPPDIDKLKLSVSHVEWI